MKIFGRILLLIAGIAVLATAIPNLVSTINELNKLGWTDFDKIPEKMELLIKVILQGLYIPFGLTAIFGAIFGKLSFFSVIFAFVLIAGIVFYMISANKAGNLSSIENIIQIIIGFWVPITYIFGVFFVAIGR